MLNIERNLPEQISEQDTLNISHFLAHWARKQPYARAVIYPVNRDANGRKAYAHLTFQQLEQESDMLAHGLEI